MANNKEIYIGLEIHVQLLTQSKMFCSCKAAFDEQPNVNVCPTCLGYPGTLPVPNMQAAEFAYKIAQALNCTLAPSLCFDRKNYFYPDLAKNYQLSQFYHPVGTKGNFTFFCDTEELNIGIIQAHLEEDAGKLVHTSDSSLCDYNRGGTPLMEIVTEPNIKTPEQAEQLLRQMRNVVRYLGVCDGNLEQGSMRCDANISLNYEGKGLGKKVEIKNINSFKFVRLALEHEVERQSKLLDNNEKIAEETRLWNENKGVTIGMREKEQANDYRYMPDPDMLPIVHDNAFFEKLEKNKIELPLDKTKRFMKEYTLNLETASFFTEEIKSANFFEQTVLLLKNNNATIEQQVSAIVTWCMTDVQKFLNRLNLQLGDEPLSAKRFAQLLDLLLDKKIHGKLAKQILEMVFTEDKDPLQIVKDNNFSIMSEEQLLLLIQSVLEKNKESVNEYKNGVQKYFGFFMGEIMKQSQGKADPIQLKKMLAEELKK